MYIVHANMETYEGLIDSPMASNTSGIAEYQVPAAFPQFQDGSSMNNSYGNISGLSGSFSGSPGASSSGLNMSGYSPSGSQQPNYGNMSSGSASSFSMPYDPPSLQPGSASHLQMASQPSPHASHGVSNKPIHSCSYCGLVLSSANALVEHKRIHTGDRPFACHICNKRFTQKAHLNIHKRIHTGEKPYACHICNKRFAQSSHLSSHKRIHTGEKPFVCEICHIGFTQKQRLDNHLKKHLDRGVVEGLARSGQMMGSASQMEQFRQGSVAGDDSSFMQIIDYMPYIKQEAGIIRDGVTGGNNHNTSNNVSSRTSEGGMGGLHSVEQASKNSNYQRGRSKRIKTESDIKVEEDDDDDGEPENSPKIAAPSFSSEGMFLHPSGYVAYGGVEDSEESNDQSPGSNPAEPLNQQGSGTAGSGHRRKPTVVRKRYSESPAKETVISPSVAAGNAISNYQQFTPLQSVLNHGNDNSDAELDGSGAEDFHDTGEMLDDKNDPPYHGNLSSKSVLTARQSTPMNAHSVVETRSHSRRNVSQPVNRSNQELINGDKLSPGAQKGGLTFTHNNSIPNTGFVKINNRISLINFTAEELITHLMKRDDVHKCQFCCLIFQDAAMYHIHRNMHDKADIRRCNMCGKLLQDKYDFTAHFLNMHQN